MIRKEVLKMDRTDKASANHRNGYNCCQAVACVFADEVGIDESLLYKMGEGFGAGMGTAQGVCGAIRLQVSCRRSSWSAPGLSSAKR